MADNEYIVRQLWALTQSGCSGLANLAYAIAFADS